MSEIAEVADADTVNREDKDRVWVEGGLTVLAIRVTVVAGDARHLANWCLAPSKACLLVHRCLEVAASHYEGFASDRLTAVVIDVLVCHEHKVNANTGNRRIVEAFA